MNLWSDVMFFLNNPVVLCSMIAIGIVLILTIVVVICCKRKSNVERDELMLMSEKIDEGMDVVNDNTSDDKIENVLSKMQEALDMKVDSSISFEQEQEENAVISYQELLASLGAKNSIDVDSIEVYDDELDGKIEISDFNKEIIDAYQSDTLDREIYKFQNDYSSQEAPVGLSLEEVPSINFQDVDVNSINLQDVDSINLQDVDVENIDVQNVSCDPIEFKYDDIADDVSSDTVYEAKHVVGNHKFKSSEFISPVYGIMKEEPIIKDDVEEIIFEEDLF